MGSGAVSLAQPDILRVAGEVDFESAVTVRQQGEALIERAAPQFRVDLSGLTSAHSVTLSVLLRWLAHARKMNKSFVIQGMPPRLFDVARVSGLETLLPLDAGSASNAPV